MRRIVFLAGVLFLFACVALAQDPVQVDPKHYKVEFENAQVRVLRIHYGPHEKSVMHSHPNAVAVNFTDLRGKFTLPDGTSQERTGKAGGTIWTPAEKHLPENLSDQPLDLVLIEMKSKPAAAPKSPAAKKKG